MKTICDCIIPFYNEGPKPLKVVEVLLKVKSISKIITIDDGSNSDLTYLELKTKFPQVISIRLEINSGKANVVKEGMKYTKSEYVFFVDGDLTNVIPIEIENTIKKIVNNPKIDMIILKLVTNIMKSDPFRLYTILSGQRILKKSDLEKIYENNFSGFQLEVAINDYMIKNCKKVFWMNSSIQNLSKYRKWGRIKGIKKVFSLFKEIADYIGWNGFIQQILFFCKQEAP
ncbi:MAG: glycosyltransferase [bacterium]|nr:glycosyltransferase [bacterium]